MNSILAALLKYLGTAVANDLEQYFNSNPTQAEIINDLLNNLASDFAQLELEVASVVVDPITFSIQSTYNSYYDVFTSPNPPSQANLADFESFLDITNTNSVAFVANNLFQGLFNQTVNFDFADPSSQQNVGGGINGIPYFITAAYSPILNGTTDLKTWGDGMLGLYTQILGYYSVLTNCAYMAATMLEKANSWTDAELSSNLNVNPAIWQGQGLAGAVVDQLNTNVLSNGMQNVNENYQFLFAFYNNTFFQTFLYYAGFVNLDNSNAIQCSPGPNASTTWGGANNASILFCSNSYDVESQSQNFNITQDTTGDYPGWCQMNVFCNRPDSNLGWYPLYFVNAEGPYQQWEVAAADVASLGMYANSLWQFNPYAGGVGQSIAYFLINQQHNNVLQTTGWGSETFEFSQQNLGSLNQMFSLQITF